jgi:uncharacterized lipoprotein YajG
MTKTKNQSTMKNLLLFLPLAFLLSCKEQAKQPETTPTATTQAPLDKASYLFVWTHPLPIMMM